MLTLTFAVSNPMDTPCKAHQASVAAVNGKPGVNVTAHVVRSATLIKAGKQAKAGDTARATAKVAKATVGAIPTHNVQVGVVTSRVTETCVKSGSGLKLVRKGKSSVANLKVDGKTTPIINKPVKIPLGPLATIWLNRTIKTARSITQRAVEIDLAGKLSTFLDKSNVSNGLMVNSKGEIVACEMTGAIVAWSPDGKTRRVITDKYDGKPLNSPNDVVVKSDDSIWFTVRPSALPAITRARPPARSCRTTFIGWMPERAHCAWRAQALARWWNMCKR